MLFAPSTNQLRSAFTGVLCTFSFLLHAQINSPYSRFGLGDVHMSGNALNRGMGGLSAAYADLQSVNFLNPASYSSIKWITFDVGAEVENRTLRNPANSEKYKSGNFAFNYVTLGMPLSKKRNWGLVFGLRPASRISYKVQTTERLNAPQTLRDSVLTLYEGSGGTYKAFVGSAIKVGGLSIGANFGYHFGQQEISTRRMFIADSLYTSYYRSNASTNTSLGNIFLEGGLQYQVKLKKETFLLIGGTYQVQHALNASRDVVRETFEYNTSAGTYTIDSVFTQTGQKGDVTFPATYTAGITLQKPNKWLIGLQYEGALWNNYRFYGQKDGNIATSNLFRAGGQITPDITSASVIKRMSYRAGFYMGNDYTTYNAKNLPVYGITLGTGIPVYHNHYALRQYLTTINIGLEFGTRGNNDFLLKENFFRVHIGFSLSDLSWFQPRKYD